MRECSAEFPWIRSKLHINWKMEKFRCKIVHGSRSYNRDSQQPRTTAPKALRTVKGMKLSRYLLMIVALVAHAFCQETTVTSAAQKIDHYYDHLHSLRIHFSETYSGIGPSRTEEGTLLLSKPSEMR